MKSRSFSRRGGQAILLSKHSNTIGDNIFAPGLSQQLSSFENLVNQLGFAGYCLGAVAGAVDRRSLFQHHQQARSKSS